MGEWWAMWAEMFSLERSFSLVRAAVILMVGLVLARMAAAAMSRVLSRYAGPQQVMLGRRIVYHSIVALATVSALREVGFELSVLLGAAGVLSVAIGFASQTSASNLMSGLFLIAERPFVVGDVIRVADTTGEVLTIDLLSAKLRTFDNLYVRIPNETLVKSQITNLTQFPIRRIDLKLGVAYKEDLAKVRRILLEVADRNPLCLQEPPPFYLVQGFGDSAIDLQFSVWAQRENFLALKNSIQEQIKAAFDASGVEIPFPHRTLYAGAVTEPFPVRVVESAAARGG